MLTRKAKYALIALQRLARENAGRPLLIADLAKEEGIPRKFLEQILLELRKQGILQSRKGKGGGYALRLAPEKISLGAVVRLMDGPLAPVSCVSQTAYAPCEECRDEATCSIRQVMKEVREAIAEILDHTTLADLRRKSDGAGPKHKSRRAQ